jgi:methionyl-tRNA formyltransferase
MMMDKQNLRIVYMGTPEFAVAGLDMLVANGYHVVGVITMPDKPAGRGYKLQYSPVKQYALEHDLPLLQPEKLKDQEFLEKLETWKADLQIVVAFRMLPEIVWAMPPLGTFNLHASLLPQYRGAAPINWAVINGEKESGVTTFFLTHEIDTGNIIMQKKIEIGDDETAGGLHDKLMLLGADLIKETVDAVINRHIDTIQQPMSGDLKNAPKIFKDTCRIDWSADVASVYNFIRGLAPYPAAWTSSVSDKENLTVKVFESEKEYSFHNLAYGSVVTDAKRWLKVAVKDGYIWIKSLQMAGKKRMPIEDFLRGFRFPDDAKLL